jgi:5-methylcytosine-specific restriction enzyme subunit McrC
VLYDRNNIFNQILRVALNVLAQVSFNPHLVAGARNLAALFETVSDIAITDQTFERLHYTRNTECYRRAIQLARLIILNYSPDVCGGKENVLAILFDMNSLFERFIYIQLKRAEAEQEIHQINFAAQISRRFWFADEIQKSIRPDIIAEIDTGPEQERVILDTKWKMPANGKPNDTDLQQMYAYNIQFGARRSFLLYPQISIMKNIEGKYLHGEALYPSLNHNCSLVFLKLFEENGKLRRDIGKDIIDLLFSTG